MPRRTPWGWQAVCLLKSEFRKKFGQKKLTKHFALSKCGGEEEARKKAVVRETIWKEKYGYPTRGYETFPQKNGTSGYPGISITSSWDKRRNKRYFCVISCWYERKKQKKAAYSIKKHGLNGALLLAMQARLRGLHGKRYVNNLMANSILKEDKVNPKLERLLAQKQLQIRERR